MADPSAQLCFGVLGVGRIGSLHAELLQHRVPSASVAGVFDVAADRAELVAKDLGIRVFDSTDQLLADDSIDAVAICTSTDTHVDLIIAAARAGKAIFCEKPVSLDPDELDRALSVVEGAGVPLHIGFNRRFDESHSAVQRAANSGELGRLRQIRITSRDPAPPPLDYIRVSGGIFLDMTIHDFDMARFVAGSEVVEVYATGATLVDEAIGAAGDFDTVSVMLTHANEVVTTIENCRHSAYGYDQRVEAFGSLGMSCSANQFGNYTTTLKAGGSTGAAVLPFFVERYLPSYVSQWEEFVAAVQAGLPTPVGAADGRAPLMIGLAALRSVREGRPIAIDDQQAPLSSPSAQ